MQGELYIRETKAEAQDILPSKPTINHQHSQLQLVEFQTAGIARHIVPPHNHQQEHQDRSQLQLGGWQLAESEDME